MSKKKGVLVIIFICLCIISIYLCGDVEVFHKIDTIYFLRHIYSTSASSHHPTRSKDQHKNESRQIHKRRVVFIVGQGRTGSTLVGSLLNEYKDNLYFFEPLRAIEKHVDVTYFNTQSNTEKTIYHSKVTDFLLYAMQCRYKKKHDQILDLFDFGSFRSFSKKLSRPPFCKSYNSQCKKVTSDLLNKFCSSTNVTLVIKDLEFRLPNKDLSFIEYLATQLENIADVYIVHLLRDPRAYLWSMKKAGWLKNTNQSLNLFASERCKETKRNLEYFTQTSNNLLHYRVMRFEDFSANPIKVTNTMTSFLKMDYPDNIKAYINEKTSSNSKVLDPYSTSARNIKNVVSKWTFEADIEFIQAVQDSCKHLMKLSGYTPLNTHTEIKDGGKVTTIQLNNSFVIL